MASPLDPTEVEALMQAIQEGQLPPDAAAADAKGPVVPYHQPRPHHSRPDAHSGFHQ